MSFQMKSSPLTITEISLAVLVAILWAICFPFIELGHRTVPPLQFATLRALIASLSILIPALIFSSKSFLSLSFWMASFGVGITYTTMGFGGMFLTEGRIAPGMATVLTNIQPFLASVTAYFVLSEKLSKGVIKGLILGFIGVLIIALPNLTSDQSADYAIGIGYILLGAFGTAFGNVLMKKYANQHNPILLTAGQLLMGSLLLFFASFWLGGWKPINWHPSFFWSLLILAIPGTSLAVVIWMYLLKSVSVTRLNVFTFLTPVFGLIIGLIFFGERISVLEFFGILVIFGGLYFIVKSE